MSSTTGDDNEGKNMGSSYLPFSDPLQDQGGNFDAEAQHGFGDRDDNHQTKKRIPVRKHIGMFWAISAPYFRETTEAKCLFAILIVLMLLDSAARIAFSYLARDFWTALGDKDEEQFYRIMQRFLIALCLLAPINVFYNFQRKRLAIKWRKWMTDRMLKLYFYNQHRIYYKLEQSSNTVDDSNFVDNPDQRLAEDVRSFTEYSLSLFLTVAISFIDLTAFSIVLYTIEPTLFFSIVAFAALGTIAACVLGRDLVRLNFQRLAMEADFRYSLVRIRDHAESIAFFRGEPTEGEEIETRLDRLLSNLYQVIATQRNLEFFTVSYNYLTWILPVVVIAPQYMEGLVELGVVQQAARAFASVLEDLSLIINQFEELTQFSASIGRLHQFVQAVRDADPDRDETLPLLGVGNSSNGDDNVEGVFHAATRVKPETLADNHNIDESISLKEYAPIPDGATNYGLALSIRGLFLKTPGSKRTLISNLDLDLKWGQKLLIIGSSGIGKSSLLRAIAGLWKSGKGSIERANISDVYFLPQKPYCPLGTLRDQLLYPHSKDSSKNPDDHMLLEILNKVDLPDLAKRSGDGDPQRGLDNVLDWSNVLSLGEQQRLAFGRVLAHKPKLVILDEATSATDVHAEARLYGLLENYTCISVGHRPTLLKYHDTKLKIVKQSEMTNTSGNYSIGSIRSNADGVASEEVDQFFR